MQYVQPIRNVEHLEQMKEVLLKGSKRNWFLFVLGINVGLRASDLLRLQVKDIQGKMHLVCRERKTGKIKRFPLNTEVKKIIEEYTAGMEEDDYLFPSHKTKKPIRRVQAYRILRAAAAEVGIGEIGTHSMRKTFGYHFYQRTKDVAVLQEIFNHSTPTVTKRYIGINQDVIDESLSNFVL